MKPAALALIALLSACSSNEKTARSDHRYENKDQGYSVDQPDGWTTSIDRGSIRFAPAAGGKHTIVVRSAPRPREVTEGKPTTNEDLVAATGRALDGLPGVRFSGRSQVEGAELAGVRFSLTFVPNGLKATYRRTHVLLLGNKRLFHVIWTGPETEPVDEGALNDMVSTLKEEV